MTMTMKLLTSAEAAERLGISMGRLRTLRGDTAGPEWGQFAGLIRYKAQELETWLAHQQDRTPD